jgi:hypothetical protein
VKVFLDSCILFEAVENRRLERLLHRCKNLGLELQTSITVIGEVFSICLQQHRRSELFEIIEICEALELHYGHGWYDIGKLYETVFEKISDYRIHPNDYAHLCHAYYMEADVFLTTDNPILENRMVKEFTRPVSPDGLRAELEK